MKPINYLDPVLRQDGSVKPMSDFAGGGGGGTFLDLSRLGSFSTSDTVIELTPEEIATLESVIVGNLVMVKVISDSFDKPCIGLFSYAQPLGTDGAWYIFGNNSATMWNPNLSSAPRYTIYKDTDGKYHKVAQQLQV